MSSASGSGSGDPTRLLLRFAEHLASTSGVVEVCEAIADLCCSELGASGAGVTLVEPDEPALRTVSLRGYPPSAAAMWRRMPLDAVTPVTIAVTTKSPAYFSDHRAWVERFPDVPLVQTEFEARCALPLIDPTADRPLGAMVLGWRERHAFDDDEQALLRTVAALCAQSISRVLAREEQERELFASAVDAMLDPVAIYTAVRDDAGKVVDFRIEYVNAAMVTPIDGRADEMVGRTLRELFPYLEQTDRLAEYAEVAETREPLFLEAVRIGAPDIEERVFDIQVAPFQDGIIIATRDVTERHQAEAELALSEARLRAAQRVGRIGSWESTRDGTTVWSAELYRMYGYEEGDPRAPQDVMLRAISEDHRARLYALIDDMFATGLPVATEYPVVTAAGDRRWFALRAEVQDGPEGPVVRGVVQDITEQRAIERALTALTEDLRDERAAAEVLQRALLPQSLPDFEGVGIHAVYESAGRGNHAGGDWYDAFPLADGRLAFTVGDVAGHGLAAAAAMSELRHAIRAFASDDPSPGGVLTRLSTMYGRWTAEPYATCLFGVLDPGAGTLSFANAGHLPMLVRAAGGGASFVPSPPGPPLAAAPFEYRSETVPVSTGDLFLLFTDGLVERRDEAIDVSLRGIAGVVVGLSDLPARDVCERLAALARQTQGEDQRPDDDICVLAVELLG